MRMTNGFYQPTRRAQSPLSSAFSIIVLLGIFLCTALVVLAGGAVPEAVHLKCHHSEGAVRDILQEHLSWLHHCGLQSIPVY